MLQKEFIKSIKSIRFIRFTKLMDPCGVLCLRQLKLPIIKRVGRKSLPYKITTPSDSPLHRGRVDYQAVSPPV